MLAGSVELDPLEAVSPLAGSLTAGDSVGVALSLDIDELDSAASRMHLSFSSPVIDSQLPLVVEALLPPSLALWLELCASAAAENASSADETIAARTLTFMTRSLGIGTAKRKGASAVPCKH